MNWAKVLFYYQQSLRTYGLSRSELERLQVRKLRAVLDYADREVPGYHEMFVKAAFDPDGLTRVEDLRKLPLHSKAEAMKLHEAALTSGRAKGAWVGTTSGTSSGQPSLIATSMDSRALAYGLRLRRRTKYGMRPWSRVATLWAPERFWRKQVVDGELRPMTGVRKFPMSLFGRNPPNLFTLWVDPLDPAKDGKALSEFRPEFINGKPSHLRRIARSSEKEFQPTPKAVLVSGEIVTETGLKEIRQGFGTRVIRNYGSSEFEGLASECVHEAGLHIHEDYKVLEILKDGEPVSEGEVGEVVVTKLYRDVVPAIRFRTGDYARLGPADRCECGSSSRRLLSVEGRDNDWIIGQDGAKFLALDVANHLERDFGLRDFRLLQRSMNGFTLLLGKDDLESDVKILDTKKYLEQVTGSEVRLEIEARTEEDYWLKSRPVVTNLESQTKAEVSPGIL